RPVEEILRLSDEGTRKPLENPARRALLEVEAVTLANHTLLTARDGTEVPVDVNLSLIRDTEGKASGAVLVFRDITERRRTEKERAQAFRVARQLAAIVETCDD